MINGGHISDAIFVAGEEDTHTFTANEGDHVEIRMADTSSSGALITNIELYGPSGNTAIAADSNNYVSVIAHTITESGTYTLLVKDASTYQNATGTYDIYFVKVPGANEHGSLINDGVHSGEIVRGDMDTYTFSANVGDYIEIRMADTSEGNTLITRMELYGPSGGNAIAASSNNYVSVIALTITEAGTYTLLAKEVSAYNATTGSYNIYFVKVPEANEHGSLTNDGIRSGTIDLGDMDTYTFSVNAGDHIEIRMADTSEGNTLITRMELYGPSGGNAIAASSNNYVSVIALTITESGTYTLLVKEDSAYNATTGSYNIYFVKVPGANEHGLLINDGVHSGEIVRGDMDTYTFSANVGDHIEIRMADTSEGNTLITRMELYGPSGATPLPPAQTITSPSSH